jgi:hypothetical protein
VKKKYQTAARKKKSIAQRKQRKRHSRSASGENAMALKNFKRNDQYIGGIESGKQYSISAKIIHRSRKWRLMK